MKTPSLVHLLIPVLVISCCAHAADNVFKVDGSTVALWNFSKGGIGGMGDESSSGIELRPYAGEEVVPLQEVDGKFGKALFFPGNAALIGTEGRVIDTPKEVTLEVWLKLDPDGENSNRGVFQYMGYGASGFRMGIAPSGHLDWLTEDGTNEVGVTSKNKLPLDEWIYVAGTYDGTMMRIFINGELDSEKQVEGGNPQGLGALLVGLISAEGPPYFRGTIEAIRISNVARTEFK